MATTADTFTRAACIAENRQSCEPALRILVASLTHHCPDLPVIIYCPAASAAFLDWLRQFPQVTSEEMPDDINWTGYDIKPTALSITLERGFDEVIWIDSDIIVTADFRPLLASLQFGTIGVTEEALCNNRDPDGLRARLWGMQVARVLPYNANTGVVRMTRAHSKLIAAWNNLLCSDAYRSAQSKPWTERPDHMMGDQEVLTALLCSEEFAHFEIEFLRRGRDIIQYFGSTGYTVSERIGTLFRGDPFFIHSQSFRPWWPRQKVSGLRARFVALYNELSPYTVAALPYRDQLEDVSWLYPMEPAARALRLLSFGNIAFSGLPLAILSSSIHNIAHIFSGMKAASKTR